jgi:CMP-N,N'-diacetyllegionaminic acid synthase
VRMACLIPVKGESKRLPGKNTRDLCGKPMFTYALAAAQQSELFGSEIFVSTDSPKVKEIAEAYGARVPYLRSDELSRDPAGVADVALDFLERAPASGKYDTLCIVLPTSPLLEAYDLLGCLDIFKKGDFSVVMAVTHTNQNAFRATTIENNVITPLFPGRLERKMSELEPTFCTSAAVTMLKVSDFLEKRTYFIHPMGAYVMDRERAIDVDTEMDFFMAQLLLERRIAASQTNTHS